MAKPHQAVYKRLVTRQVSLEVGAGLAEDPRRLLCVEIFSPLLNLPAVAPGYDEPSIEVKGNREANLFLLTIKDCLSEPLRSFPSHHGGCEGQGTRTAYF